MRVGERIRQRMRQRKAEERERKNVCGKKSEWRSEREMDRGKESETDSYHTLDKCSQ